MEKDVVTGSQTLVEFRTDRAKVFQAIAKILEKNFIEATFMVTEHGIFLQESNSTGDGTASIIFEVMLRRQKFLVYTVPIVESPDATVCLGFSTSDFKNALDRIIKTDSFRMYVLASDPEILHLEIISSAGNRTEKFITLRKTTVGQVIPPNYNDHIPTVVIQPSPFRKATTDANKNSKTQVKISAQTHGLRIEGTGSQIRGLKDTFGKWVDGQPEIYNELISTQKLHSFSEIAVSNIAETIQIYASGDGRPLKLSADAGSLGTVSMYLS